MLLTEGPGKNSLRNTLNSAWHGPEQSEGTLKLGLLQAGGLAR